MATDDKPISDKEIEEETDIVDADVEKELPRKKKEIANPFSDPKKQTRIDKPLHWRRLQELKEEKKDGTGYGDLNTTNIMPSEVNSDSETYVGLPAEKEQTYIQQEQKTNIMERPDSNKITHTKIGDHINYFENGISGSGVVAKMSSKYITVFKEDGSFQEIHINDTFHVSDILINKTWNDMSMEERTELLLKYKVHSPRFLHKAWEQLPTELRAVMQSDVEHGTYGNAGRNPEAGVSTDTAFDAPKDYEGATHRDYSEQFEYEEEKPKTDKDKAAMTTADAGTVNPTHLNSKDSRFHKKVGEFTYSEKPNYKTKGVPDYNINTWGIRYVKKGEEEKEE